MSNQNKLHLIPFLLLFNTNLFSITTILKFQRHTLYVIQLSKSSLALNGGTYFSGVSG